MLLGLLTALSYSDLVKSWRGECGGIGISTRVGQSMCIRAFLHVGHARSLQVHVAPYDMKCAYVTLRGPIRLLYKV